MNRVLFYLHYAWRSIQRDGTRTFLAVVCIVFGVLSLVSMQSLAKTLLSGNLFDARLQIGGDVSIRDANHPYLNSQQIEQIAQWQRQGILSTYTLISRGSAQYLHSMTSGRVMVLFASQGIDARTYPLAGSLTLSEPTGRSAADVLTGVDDALLTTDIAAGLGLHIGDMFVLGGGDAAPTRLKLAGIVNATPAQHGRMVYYSLETAKRLENREDVVSDAVAILGSTPNAAKILMDDPLWTLFARDIQPGSSAVLLFQLMFKGAGVLGLLIGGIGISNTLQVILARRKVEVAVLKSVGMRSRDLLILIGLETGLVGLIGGVVGGLLGVWLTSKLIQTLVSSGALLLNWSADPGVLLGSIALGVFTAVIFGIQAILAASSVRPIALLRNLPVSISRRTHVTRFVMYAGLALLFGALVGVVLGSLLEGVLIVLGGALLLIVLQGVFWVFLWMLLQLSLPFSPILNIARKNLQQRKRQSTLIVIALFAGTFAVTFAAIAIYNAQEQFSVRQISDDGYNIMAFTTVDQAEAVRAQFIAEQVTSSYTSAVFKSQEFSIEGRSDEDWRTDIELVSGQWTGKPDGTIINMADNDRLNESLKLGDPVAVRIDSETYTFTVTGFYRPRFKNGENIAGQPFGLIIPAETARKIGGNHLQIRVVGRVAADQLVATVDRLGKALPESLIFSKAEMNEVLTSTLRSLFLFAITIAGLAFVAGAVLIANSTGLTVVERYREIGIFKAVGYTSSRVMRLLLFEYILIGIIGSAIGIIADYAAVALINLSQPGARLVIAPLILVVMVALSMLIAVVSATLFAWKPTRVRPLHVLRYD